MIAAWMLYCAVCALGLSVAAILAERVLLAGRGPVRYVWLGALVLSLFIPIVALRNPSRPRPADPVRLVTQDAARTAAHGAVVAATRPISVLASPPTGRATSTPVRRWDWRATLAHADRPLTVAWLMLSSALAVYFFGGIAVLSMMRRTWQPRVVLGVPVFVSEHTGPALVGAVSPAIVVPKWALDMEPRQLALMLQHEQEHRRARDGQLLTVAQLALIAMPWNAALWWQLVRLRVAVEMDCDARVLRDADARSYGDLLLEVVRPGRGLRLVGATAFAERTTQLERRIRVMVRRRDPSSRGARALAASIALATMTAAWAAPRPAALVVFPVLTATPAPALLPVQLPVQSPALTSVTTSRAADPSSSPRTKRVVELQPERARLSDATVNALLRYGTAGIINPMLMILRDADSLALCPPSGQHRDSQSLVPDSTRCHLGTGRDVLLPASQSPRSEYAQRHLRARPTSVREPAPDDRARHQGAAHRRAMEKVGRSHGRLPRRGLSGWRRIRHIR